LKRHNISVPASARKEDSEEEEEEYPKKGHALKACCTSTPAFLIDSGASNHMAASIESFSSFQSFDGPSIQMGNNSKVQTKGKGSIQLEHGRFKDVLFVPSLASNLLSVYQMTHTGSPKRVIFGPDSVEITDISTGSIIAKGIANHASRAYEFSHFMPPSEPVHSQQPPAREGKNIASTSFTASTSIADPSILVYDIKIQGDSDLDSVPTSKLEARKMTENSPDTQKEKTLALCHTVLPPSERCNRLPVRCNMARAQSSYIQKNGYDHTPLHSARDKGYSPPSFHHQFWRKRRSLHARPQNTCAQHTMHAASLPHRDEDCSNIFSSFSNLRPDSTCLDRRRDFFPCGFFPSYLY